jgi:hypothetical protein
VYWRTNKGDSLSGVIEALGQGDFMIGVVRWTALILEVVGVYFTVKLCHAGDFKGAALFFVFDTLMVLVFVCSHVLAERVLEKYSVKRRGNWWL